MALSAAVALVVERLAYRPLIKRGSPKLVILISAIGASFSLSEIMGLRDNIVGWFGLGDTTGPHPKFGPLHNYVADARNVYSSPISINRHKVFELGNYGVTDVDLLVLFSALLMMVALDFFVRRTRLGRGIRSVAQDPEAAALMGVNSTRVIRTTFLIGGLMAGAAATLYMIRIGTTRNDAGFLIGVKAFTAAVMGGIGNLRGALIGGLLLGVMENWGSAVFGSNWKDVVTFVLLVVILLVRPTGILGESLGKARA
jgi:branched-chain amino acid transport system permease protein